jgi:hypothetical protein
VERPLNTVELRNDSFLASQVYLKKAVTDKRSYFKKAVVNPYNLTLLIGALAASIITLNPILAVFAVGLEILWMVFGPENKFLKKVLWDPQFDSEESNVQRQDYLNRISALDDSERVRVANLVARQQEINRLAAQNPSFTGELLRTELAKTDRLVDSFIDMAVTCARYGRYLKGVNLSGLESERMRWESIIKHSGAEDEELSIAKKNLAIVMKRFDKMKEIQHYLTIARGQLDLIENSFQLISDQIVTMNSPQELSGQLDELLDGVESIKETAIEAEGILGSSPLGIKE